METTAEERIKKEISKSGLSVSRIYAGQYQKEGTETAELRQAVTTKSTYPAISIANDKQDNLFGMEEFGAVGAGQSYENTENRVAWIDVPAGTTMEQMAAKLAANPNAGLYRILANKPILTSNQKAGIEANLTTYDVFADRQVVRFPENEATVANNTAGKLALDSNGKPQYRAIFFKSDSPVDQDLRSPDEHFYASPAIQAELDIVAHTVVDQEL